MTLVLFVFDQQTNDTFTLQKNQQKLNLLSLWIIYSPAFTFIHPLPPVPPFRASLDQPEGRLLLQIENKTSDRIDSINLFY